MGLFDKMKQAASAAGGNQTVTFTFQELPESLAQMQALPEASLDTPFKTAASPSVRCAPTVPTRTSERRCSTGCAAPAR